VFLGEAQQEQAGKPQEQERVAGGVLQDSRLIQPSEATVLVRSLREILSFSEQTSVVKKNLNSNITS